MKKGLSHATDWAAVRSIIASLSGQPEGPKGTFQDSFAESISQGNSKVVQEDTATEPTQELLRRNRARLHVRPAEHRD